MESDRTGHLFSLCMHVHIEVCIHMHVGVHVERGRKWKGKKGVVGVVIWLSQESTYSLHGPEFRPIR